VRASRVCGNKGHGSRLLGLNVLNSLGSKHREVYSAKRAIEITVVADLDTNKVCSLALWALDIHKWLPALVLFITFHLLAFSFVPV